MVSAAMVTSSVVVVMMFLLVVMMMLLLNIDNLGLRGCRGCIIDWRRGTVGVLVGKRLILIPVLRIVAVHFINYNY